MSAVASKAAKKYNVRLENDRFPAAMLVKELVPNALNGRKWHYADSPVMAVSEEDAARYDATLAPLEKKPSPARKSFIS